MKKYKIVYTTGVFDLFHIGHLETLKNAKELGEILIVGVSTDELVKEYKGKTPVIPFEERIAIIQALKCVDIVVPQTTRDKTLAYEALHFDMMYVEETCKDQEVFVKAAQYLKSKGACIEYFPRKNNTSSTIITEVIKKIYNDTNFS